MRLLGDRAMHWPARQRLLIADLHLGKADVFRQAGIGLPSRRHPCTTCRGWTTCSPTRRHVELWILGDVLHGPALQSRWRDGWDRVARTRIGSCGSWH